MNELVPVLTDEERSEVTSCCNRSDCSGTFAAVERVIAARVAAAHRAGGVEALRELDHAIHAAKPKHLTRDYTPVDQAYDFCAGIARARANQMEGKK